MENISLHRLWSFHRWRIETIETHILSLDLSALPIVPSDLLIPTKAEISKPEKYLLHMMAAEEIWLSRIEKRSPEYPASAALPALFANWKASNTKWAKWIAEMPNGWLEYQTMAGEKFQNRVEEIVIHLVDHATYHTGQLMTTLKNEGLPTINTGIIQYYREISPSEV